MSSHLLPKTIYQLQAQSTMSISMFMSRRDEKAHKQASKQASKPASQPASQPASKQTNKQASKQASKQEPYCSSEAAIWGFRCGSSGPCSNIYNCWRETVMEILLDYNTLMNYYFCFHQPQRTSLCMENSCPSVLKGFAPAPPRLFHRQRFLLSATLQAIYAKLCTIFCHL